MLVSRKLAEPFDNVLNDEANEKLIHRKSHNRIEHEGNKTIVNPARHNIAHAYVGESFEEGGAWKRVLYVQHRAQISHETVVPQSEDVLLCCVDYVPAHSRPFFVHGFQPWTIIQLEHLPTSSANLVQIVTIAQIVLVRHAQQGCDGAPEINQLGDVFVAGGEAHLHGMQHYQAHKRKLEGGEPSEMVETKKHGLPE